MKQKTKLNNMNSFENNQANVPVAGAEARLSETGIVEYQISAGQDERGQATTAASAVELQELASNNYHGKAIYKPSGKAGEYSPWAANFYKGCPHACKYCYNNKGLTSATLGGTNVRLKTSLVNEQTAFGIFCKELDKCRGSIIRDGGLHFNFVSDPCLPETIDLNWRCIDYAIANNVTCQVLTKRADWLGHPAVQNALAHPDLLRVGFSLTGCDDYEPGASSNGERIEAMKSLHCMGITTWASIEPIIDPKQSFQMITRTVGFCDHYKIGILSGRKDYSPQQIRSFVAEVSALNLDNVYWKKSLLEFISKT